MAAFSLKIVSSWQSFLNTLAFFPRPKSYLWTAPHLCHLYQLLGEYLAPQEVFATTMQLASRACSSKKDTEIWRQLNKLGTMNTTFRQQNKVGQQESKTSGSKQTSVHSFPCWQLRTPLHPHPCLPAQLWGGQWEGVWLPPVTENHSNAGGTRNKTRLGLYPAHPLPCALPTGWGRTQKQYCLSL